MFLASAAGAYLSCPTLKEAKMTILGVLLVVVGALLQQPDVWSIGVVLGLVDVIVALTSRALRISTTEMRRHYY